MKNFKKVEILGKNKDMNDKKSSLIKNIGKKNNIINLLGLSLYHIFLLYEDQMMIYSVITEKLV